MDNVAINAGWPYIQDGRKQKLLQLTKTTVCVCVPRLQRVALRTFPGAMKNKVSALRSMVFGGTHAEAKQYVEVYCRCVSGSAGSIVLLTGVGCVCIGARNINE